MYRQLQALFRLPRRVAGNAIRPKPSPATIVRKRLYWRFYLVFFVVAVAAACSISCLSVAASSCCPNTDSSGAGSCSMLPGSLYTFARNREIQARISLARTRIRQSAKPKALDHTTDQCSLSTFDGAKPKLWALSRSHTRNMWSSEPATARRPSGVIATALTQPVWHVSLCSVWPLSRSQTRQRSVSGARHSPASVRRYRHRTDLIPSS